MRKINKTVLAVAFLFGLEIALAIQVRELDRELGRLIEANRHRQEFETLTPVCGNPDLVLTRTSE